MFPVFYFLLTSRARLVSTKENTNRANWYSVLGSAFRVAGRIRGESGPACGNGRKARRRGVMRDGGYSERYEGE